MELENDHTTWQGITIVVGGIVIGRLKEWKISNPASSDADDVTIKRMHIPDVISGSCVESFTKERCMMDGPAEDQIDEAESILRDLGIECPSWCAPTIFQGRTRDGKFFHYRARYEYATFGVGINLAAAQEEVYLTRKSFYVGSNPEASWLTPEESIFILSMFLEDYYQRAVGLGE
jgi:hypothetical protein